MDDTRTRRRTGPRDAEKIFTAVFEMLAEGGYDHLTVEGAAARSGVNKTTIYRWWRSKDALLGAALLESARTDLVIPDAGSLHGDLLAMARHIIALLTREPTASAATAVVSAAGHRPELAEIAQRFFTDRLAGVTVILDRAAARGELPGGTDPMSILDLLAGPIWFRILIRQEPLRGNYAEQLVESVLHAVLAHPERTRHLS